MHTEFLFIVAEVAVAFAGFAGLVFAISARRDQEPEQTRLQFELLLNVLSASLLVIAFALIPPMIADIGASPDTTWRGSALLFAIAFGSYIVYSLRRSYPAYRAAGRSVPVSFQVNSFLAIFFAGLLVLCAAGVVPASAYRATLLFCLYASGASFLRVFLSLARD